MNQAHQPGPAIWFADVTKRYGPVLALDQVSFTWHDHFTTTRAGQPSVSCSSDPSSQQAFGP